MLFIRATRATVFSLAVAGLVSVAWSPSVCAQEPVGAEIEEAPSPPPERLVYANGHVWVSAGVRTPIVSVARTTRGSILALTARGAVVRIDAAGGVQETLQGERGSFETEGEVDEEDILMDAEGLMEEIQSLMDDAEEESIEEDSDDDLDPDESVERATVPETADVDSMAEMADLWVGDDRGDGADLGPRTGAVVWASSALEGVAIASRADGLWVTEDDGQTWFQGGQVLGIHAFADGHAGHFLAGTAFGLRVSTDQGRTWEKVNDPIVGVEIYAFARDGGRIYAGTTEGLFRSEDGLRWAKTLSRYDTDVPVWSIAVDPHWKDGLWVTGPVGILRSDDGGELLRAAARNMLPGTVSLLALDAPGHILAAGLDGVWESIDGGVRWRPVANGLPSPVNRLLLNGPVVAGMDGLYALKSAEGGPETPAVERTPEPVSASVGILVATALNRPGMDMDNVLTQGSLVRSLLLPSLQINARRTRNRHITGDYDARSNRGASRGVWAVGVTACFGSCAGSSSQAVADMAVSGDDGALYEAVTVVGDEVYSIAEAGSLAPMAANVSERLTRYRTDIASVVGELALVRLRLIDARGTVGALSLREQVNHQLDVLEATARLDVYTNGYLSRVLEGS